jgi:hypothetical protein
VSDICYNSAALAVEESARSVQRLICGMCSRVALVRSGVSLTIPSEYTICKASILERGEHLQ